jgi:hypothetical protein
LLTGCYPVNKDGMVSYAVLDFLNIVVTEIFMESTQMWNNLQEPSRPSRFTPGYLLLLAAVDTGWQVSEPVLVQSVLPDHERCSYAFLLTNNHSTTSLQLVVPQCHDVDVFIRSEGLRVIDNCCS